MATLREIAEKLEARAGGSHLDDEINPASARSGSLGGLSVTNDSRRVLPGGLFIAIKGAKLNGNEFIDEALKRGAVGIISEEPMPGGWRAAWLQVKDARAALAKTAAIVHDYPSRELQLVGVTGTNGKTTVAHLVESIFRAAGKKSALMGTISYRIGDQNVAAEFTTPEASEIQGFLYRAVQAGTTHAVMEVSSHALALHRADQLEFAVAAFTNLTQDHLDLHGSMEAYFAAKRKLFDGSIGTRPQRAVINLDDPRGAELLELCGASALTYALDARADITTVERDGARRFTLDGLRFKARTPAGEIEINSPLIGRPFAANILCAVGIGVALGFAPEVIAQGINASRGAAGRFEKVALDGEDDITVIVDYAHTPDALKNVLAIIGAAQGRDASGNDPLGTARGRIITVMGCGGDRDRTKRPLMGEEAARGSDWTIATSDNPRSEDPIHILNDIRVGLDRVGRKYEMIVDRREAIFRAITSARAGDVILLAGKGHEDYQILADGKIHFDDREVAREALQERRSIKLRR